MNTPTHRAGESSVESIGVAVAQQASAAVALPRIYVFCNRHAPQWHSFVALAEDGTVLAGHVCSEHYFAPGDMGITEESDKRDAYAAHYPNGYELEYVEATSRADTIAHRGLFAALARAKT